MADFRVRRLKELLINSLALFFLFPFPDWTPDICIADGPADVNLMFHNDDTYKLHLNNGKRYNIVFVFYSFVTNGDNGPVIKINK